MYELSQKQAMQVSAAEGSAIGYADLEMIAVAGGASLVGTIVMGGIGQGKAFFTVSKFISTLMVSGAVALTAGAYVGGKKVVEYIESQVN